MSQETVYALLKDQCMGAFTAELIGRSDMITVGPQAQILLEKVETTLKSQYTFLSNLISTSLSEKSSTNIFSVVAKNAYGKFIFLLTVTKLLTRYFELENGETAKLFVQEIQTLLDDTTFKTSLYEDQDYLKLVTPPDTQNSVSELEHEKETSVEPVVTQPTSYWQYGLGTLVLSGVGLLALTLVKSKRK